MGTELEPPIRVRRPSDLAERGLAIVEAGDREIVILVQDGPLRAVDRWCPHEDGDLGEGMMFRGNIKCPVHGYIFSLTAGRCLNAFGMAARVYEVGDDGDELVLRALSQPATRGA
jgi:nitrite reductase/ring-hydroxylating ferredoxin subunit